MPLAPMLVKKVLESESGKKDPDEGVFNKAPQRRWFNRDPGAKPGYKGPNMADVQREVGNRAAQLENQGMGFARRTAVKALGGKVNTPAQAEVSNNLRAYSQFGPNAMKGMIEGGQAKPKPKTEASSKQSAYDFGYAVGLLKSGSVARVERKNRMMMKLAQLLQRKLTKSAVERVSSPEENRWGTPSGSSWNPLTHLNKLIGRTVEYEPGAAEKQDTYRQMMEEEAKRLEGMTPPTSMAQDVWKQHIADVRARGQKPMGSSGAAGKVPTKARPKPKATEEEGDMPKPISIDMDPKERRLRQQGKWQEGGEGGEGGEGRRREDQSGFWAPQFGDIRDYWMQLMGITPGQYEAENRAREAGVGRAYRHKANLDWLRSVLLGPGTGHYGM